METSYNAIITTTHQFWHRADNFIYEMKLEVKTVHDSDYHEPQGCCCNISLIGNIVLIPWLTPSTLKMFVDSKHCFA